MPTCVSLPDSHLINSWRWLLLSAPCLFTRGNQEDMSQTASSMCITSQSPLQPVDWAGWSDTSGGMQLSSLSLFLREAVTGFWHFFFCCFCRETTRQPSASLRVFSLKIHYVFVLTHALFRWAAVQFVRACERVCVCGCNTVLRIRNEVMKGIVLRSEVFISSLLFCLHIICTKIITTSVPLQIQSQQIKKSFCHVFFSQLILIVDVYFRIQSMCCMFKSFMGYKNHGEQKPGPLEAENLIVL